MGVIAGDELLSPDDLRRQGEEDYRNGIDFWPVRHPYGSPEWAAWYDGVIAAKDAEKENQHERTA
jgi:hypothetical protein